MSLLKDISIKHFRGIDSLELQDLKKVNLIVGQNNTGKSTVLEAMFLLVGMSNPTLIPTINRFRGINRIGESEFKYLFHKLDFELSPSIEANLVDTSFRKLDIIPIFKKLSDSSQSIGDLNEEHSGISTNSAIQSVSGLDLRFSSKKKHSGRKTGHSSIKVVEGEVQLNPSKDYKEPLHGALITSQGKEEGALQRVSELIKKKREDVLVEALRKIEPGIQSIHALPEGIFLTVEGFSELIPSNISGDGLRRFLNIVATIAEKPNSIILIDEIENGLHFLSQQKLWETMISLASDYNNQLVITSHNIETIKYFAAAVQSFKEGLLIDDAKLINIAHTEAKGIQQYDYTIEDVKKSLNNEIEIR